MTCYERAASQALEGNDFASAIERARKAIDCGAGGERLGALLAIQAEAHRWGAFDEAARCLDEALALLPPGPPSGTRRPASSCRRACASVASTGSTGASPSSRTKPSATGPAARASGRGRAPRWRSSSRG